MSPDLRGSWFDVGDVVKVKSYNYVGRVEAVYYGIRQSQDEYKIVGLDLLVKQDDLEKCLTHSLV